MNARCRHASSRENGFPSRKRMTSGSAQIRAYSSASASLKGRRRSRSVSRPATLQWLVLPDPSDSYRLAPDPLT